MVKQSYFVLGDPGCLAYGGYRDGRMWETHKNLRERWIDQLLDQHSPASTINKPIDLHVEFLFQKTHATKKAQPFPKRGEIIPLLRFVEECLSTSILKNPCLIIGLTCKKQYVDSNPRTEFYITENHG
jgi:Holliday junction resolvase RusA-like endonuclease